MGFVEDEEKMFAEGMKAESKSIATRTRRNKKILIVLLLIALGAVAIVFNGYRGGRKADDLFTNDPELKRHIVESWIHVGFVIGYDIPSSTCTFSDAQWNSYNDEEKKAVVLLLDSYYANVQVAGHSGITLKGLNNGDVLASSGPRGVVLR